jgi:hypothetical protein
VKKVDGVKDASFSFETGQGWVTYDSTVTEPRGFIVELERMTGFSAAVKPEKRGRGWRIRRKLAKPSSARF